MSEKEQNEGLVTIDIEIGKVLRGFRIVLESWECLRKLGKFGGSCHNEHLLMLKGVLSITAMKQTYVDMEGGVLVM